jgi:hypothetical protein
VNVAAWYSALAVPITFLLVVCGLAAIVIGLVWWTEMRLAFVLVGLGLSILAIASTVSADRPEYVWAGALFLVGALVAAIFTVRRTRARLGADDDPTAAGSRSD